MYAQVNDEWVGPIEEVRSDRSYSRLRGAAAVAMPELAFAPRLLRGAGRRWVLLAVAGSVAFIAAIAAVIFVWNAANEKTARQATTRFGAALVHNDPHAAPPGTAQYISGVRAYFGPVTSAQLIGSHQRAVGHDPDTRTFFVAELLLGTHRGPAVVEVEFDNDSINSDRVSRVYELEPGSAPGLSSTQRNQLDVAFKARGNKPADAATLELASSTVRVQGASAAPSAPTPIPATPSTRVPTSTASRSPITGAAAKQLRCVQAAHRDVAKLARCAAP